MDWIAGFLLLFGVFLVAGIVWAIWSAVSGARKASQIEDEIRNLPDFDAADVYVSVFNQAGVAIDRNRRQILLASRDGLRTYSAESIISCEVLEDGVQLAYANRGSQLLGVAAGGALLGGVGAVIGGLSGSQRTMQRVESVVLRFKTDDFDNPVHDILLAQGTPEKGMGKSDALYRHAIEDAHRWHARTLAMMKAASPDVA